MSYNWIQKDKYGHDIIVMPRIRALKNGWMKVVTGDLPLFSITCKEFYMRENSKSKPVQIFFSAKGNEKLGGNMCDPLNPYMIIPKGSHFKVVIE